MGCIGRSRTCRANFLGIEHNLASARVQLPLSSVILLEPGETLRGETYGS